MLFICAIGTLDAQHNTIHPCGFIVNPVNGAGHIHSLSRRVILLFKTLRHPAAHFKRNKRALRRSVRNF